MTGMTRESEMIDDVNRIYTNEPHPGDDCPRWKKTSFLGQPIAKAPSDLWVYQEIMTEVRPSLVIETGTFDGGSAYYFATLMDLLRIERGRVLTVDVFPFEIGRRHDRVTYVAGSSVDLDVVAKASDAAASRWPVLVSLDSCHEPEHVMSEMRVYANLVTRGSYMVVEDTAFSTLRDVVRAFVEEDRRFEVDLSRERHIISQNKGGWLKRIVLGRHANGLLGRPSATRKVGGTVRVAPARRRTRRRSGRSR